MQIITSLKVEVNNQIVHITHRSNNEHNSSMHTSMFDLSKIEVNTWVTDDAMNANVNDIINVWRPYVDFNNPVKLKGKVISKNQMGWDFSKPVGQRKVNL